MTQRPVAAFVCLGCKKRAVFEGPAGAKHRRWLLLFFILPSCWERERERLGRLGMWSLCCKLETFVRPIWRWKATEQKTTHKINNYTNYTYYVSTCSESATYIHTYIQYHRIKQVQWKLQKHGGPTATISSPERLPQPASSRQVWCRCLWCRLPKGRSWNGWSKHVLSKTHHNATVRDVRCQSELLLLHTMLWMQNTIKHIEASSIPYITAHL